MESEKKNFLIGCLCAVLCEMIFGLSFLFTKHVTEHISPLTLLGWRFLFSFILINICAFTKIIRIDFSKFFRKEALPVIAASIFHPVLYFTGETVGICLTTASETGIIIATLPIITIVIAAIFLKERPTVARIIGILTTFAGVLLCIVPKSIDATFNPLGYAVLFMGLIAYALYCICVRKSASFTSADITYIMLFSGSAVFTSVSFITNFINGTLSETIFLPVTDFGFLEALIYLSAACSILGFMLNAKALEKIGPSAMSPFVGISTIVTITASVLFLHESITLEQALGTILILAGVYIATLLNVKKGIVKAKILKSDPRSQILDS